MLSKSDLQRYNGKPTPKGTIQIYGHRGARALYPENTLEGYRAAIAMGVHYIDADVVMSKEGVLVVAHDTHLNPNITRDVSGNYISSLNPPAVDSFTVKELKTYDVGTINAHCPYAAYFPDQKKMSAKIPTLEEVIDILPENVGLQVELKSGPPIQETAENLTSLLARKGVIDRTEVQSFDWRYLKALQTLDSKNLNFGLSSLDSEGVAPQIGAFPDKMRGQEPHMRQKRRQDASKHPEDEGVKPKAQVKIKTAYLTVETEPASLELIAYLGGSVWGPFEMNVTQELVEKAHALGLKVVPWGWPEKEGTAFNEACIRHLIQWDVDGIITDSPEQLAKLYRSQKIKT